MLSVFMLNVANKPFMLSVMKMNAFMMSAIKLNAVMLSVIKRNAVMLSVIKRNAVMLSVIMLNVVAPPNLLFTFNKMKKVFIGVLKQIRGISQLISALSKFSRFSKKVFCTFLSKMG
jgi:hypothetical protein